MKVPLLLTGTKVPEVPRSKFSRERKFLSLLEIKILRSKNAIIHLPYSSCIPFPFHSCPLPPFSFVLGLLVSLPVRPPRGAGSATAVR